MKQHPLGLTRLIYIEKKTTTYEPCHEKTNIMDLRNVSTQISLRCPHRLIRAETGGQRYDEMFPKIENAQKAKSVCPD